MTLPEVNAMFTFENDDVHQGYISFDRTKWATYMEAMQEDKPPPDCSRRTKKSDVSKGAAYLARKTLLLTEEFFRVRYNEAIQLTQGKLNIRNYARRAFFKEEQHAECVSKPHGTPRSCTRHPSSPLYHRTPCLPGVAQLLGLRF